jgi:hypothetical protein
VLVTVLACHLGRIGLDFVTVHRCISKDLLPMTQSHRDEYCHKHTAEIMSLSQLALDLAAPAMSSTLQHTPA